MKSEVSADTAPDKPKVKKQDDSETTVFLPCLWAGQFW
jgi:hypothetical protein